MSTVNLAEALIRIRDRQPQRADELSAHLLNSGIRFIAPDEAQAAIAARARHAFPLNLGDCFAYALAAQQTARSSRWTMTSAGQTAPSTLRKSPSSASTPSNSAKASKVFHHRETRSHAIPL
jgi:hypothetical protein